MRRLDFVLDPRPARNMEHVMRSIVLLAVLILLILPSCQPSPGLPDRERQEVSTSPDGLETELETTGDDPLGKASESGPKTVRGYIRQGYNLLLVGKEEEAQHALQMALRQAPKNKQATMLLQQIKADPVAVLGSTSFEYHIRPNDSLTGLAQRFLNDPFKFYLLAKYNGLSNPSRIRVGQVIQIPGEAPASPSAPPTALSETPPAAAPESAERSESSEPAEPADTNAPNIELETPATLRDASEMTVTEDTVNVSGTVTDPAGLFVFAINGKAIDVDADGRFAYPLQLQAAENVLRLTAVDIHRNEAESTYRIMYEPPKPMAEAKIAAPPFGRYHALVIGINTYRHMSELSTAVTDTAAITRLLEDQYGFDVTFLPDARRTDIVRVLENLQAILTPQDNLLIYYAGHGRLDEASGDGYWLPLDAQPNSREQWLANAAISELINGMAAKHVMVIADSSYTGTFARNGDEAANAAPDGDRKQRLQRIDRQRSRTAMTSGGLKPILDPGGGKHSVFAKAFLTVLYTNGEILEGARLFAKMRPWVEVSSEQRPGYANISSTAHEGGDFLFVPGVGGRR